MVLRFPEEFPNDVLFIMLLLLSVFIMGKIFVISERLFIVSMFHVSKFQVVSMFHVSMAKAVSMFNVSGFLSFYVSMCFARF